MAKGRKQKNRLARLLIIGGVAVGAAYLWVRHQLQFLQFGTASVPFQQLKGQTLNLGIKLPIINASSIGISMSRFSGYIKSPTGSILGTVYLQGKVEVPKGSQGVASFMAQIPLSGLLSEIVSIVMSGGKPDFKGYKVEGQAWVYGVPIPVKTSIL